MLQLYLPGVANVTPSDFVISKSACNSESVSVAALLDVSGSVTPFGAVTVAVLLSVPVAVDKMLHVAEKVARPPIGNVVIAALMMLPVPGAVHTAPKPAHDHEQPVSAAGNESDTVAPLAALGPLFVTTIVYVTDEPDKPKFC